MPVPPVPGTKRYAMISPSRGTARAPLTAALAALVFAGAISCGFVWDDVILVEENQRIRHVAAIPSFFVTDYVGGDYPTGIYRPAVLTAFTLEYSLFGTDPAPWHAVNLAIHVANVLLLFAVGRRLFADATPAWIASFLFALHPAVSETVIGLAGLSGLLSAFFGLAAWYLFPRGAKGLAAATILYLFSILSKESGAVWLVPMLLEPVLRAGCERTGRGISPGRAGALFSALALYIAMRMNATGAIGVPAGGQILGGADLATRAVTMLRGYAEYIRLLFFPLRLAGDYSPDAIVVSARLDGAAIAGLAFLAATFAALVVALKRNRSAAAGILLLLAGLAPVSNVILPIGAVIAERFLYLPLVGFALFAGGVLHGALRKKPAAAVAITLLAGLPLGVRSAARGGDWRDHETFMESLIRAVPKSYRSYEAIAERELRLGHYEKALAAQEEAYRIYPEDRSLRTLRARILKGAGRLDEAAAYLSTMVAEMPRERRSRLLLAETLFEAKRFNEALKQYRAALETYGDDYRAWIGIGRSEDELGRQEEAADAYRRAVALRPDLADACMRIGLIAMEEGRYEEARQWFRRVRDGTNRLGALLLRGRISASLGDMDDAANAFREAATVEPRSPAPWIEWGKMLEQMGKKDEAAEKYRRAKRLERGKGDTRPDPRPEGK